MTQDERDPTKWRLAEPVTLGPGQSERAMIFLDGQEPTPLGPSLFPTSTPVNTLFLAIPTTSSGLD